MAAPPQLAADDLISLLQTCRRKKDPRHAKNLLAYMQQHHLETHAVLGNHLVRTLAECGSLPEAERVFNGLRHWTHHSCNSLLLGYVNCGEPQEALRLYQKFQEDAVQPNNYMYVALLKACSMLNDAEQGRHLHTEVIKQGLETDLFVGSAMIDLYSKCGCLADSCGVFQKLPIRDTVAWNAHIMAYAEHGLLDEALSCLELMQAEGISPADIAFVCTLKGCGNIGSIEMGNQLYNEVLMKGLEKDVFVGSTIVDMYAKCGFLVEAQQVLDQLPGRNVVSWNALLAAYAEHGLGKEVLSCFEQMQSDNIASDCLTLTSCLKGCSSIGATEKGQEMHAEVVKRGLEGDFNIGTTLVDMYAKSKFFLEAQQVFCTLPNRDAISWAALISGYAEQGCMDEVLNCFKQMQLENVSPVPDTFVCSLKACGLSGVPEAGQEIHAELTKMAIENDVHVSTALMNMYCKFGLLAEAQLVFDRLRVQDAVSWTTLTCGYVDNELSHEALRVFKQLQQEGMMPAADTYACSLKACCNARDLGRGQEIHAEIVKRGFENELFVGTTLVVMYAKCGSLAEAQKEFDSLTVQDAISWTSLVAGYTEHGHDEEALNCFSQMQRKGLSPDAGTFACSLKACGTTGALFTGHEIHADVTKRGFEKDVFVGSTLVDMYSILGSLAEAQHLFLSLPSRDVALWNAMIKGYGENHEGHMAIQCFNNMQEQGVKPNAITFTCLLVACSHSSLVLKGHEYFKLMTEVHDIKPTLDHYTCMVDLLARSGLVCEAEKFAQAMQCLPSKEIIRALLTACKIHGTVDMALRCFEKLVQSNKVDATAYLLMADVYVFAGKWMDAKKLEEMRVQLEAKKKPANALIEVTGTLHEFVVKGQQNKAISTVIRTLSPLMRHKGYVPIVDSVITQVCEGDKELNTSDGTKIVLSV